MTVLVTGATGLVGRSLIAQLLNTGARVRALSRRPDTADLPAGVNVVVGDVHDPTSLSTALAGVDAVYLFTGGPTTGGFATAAHHAGVRRVVVLSGLGNQDPTSVEKPLSAAGLDWTHLRPGAFAANALWQFGEAIRNQATVSAPYLDAALAPIHETDIAAVAATTLQDEGHTGKRYPLTGPAPVTYRQQIGLIGQAIGRDVTCTEEPPEQVKQGMLAGGMPEPIAEQVLTRMAEAITHPATVEPTVEQVTGEPPRTFAQWASDHAHDFR